MAFSGSDRGSGSDQESDDSDVDDILDLLESTSSESESDKEDEKLTKVERKEYDDKVDRPLDELVAQNVKKYQNTSGGKFLTGVDVTSKEAKTKREKRAQRFGLSKEDSSGYGSEDVSAVVLPPGSKIDGYEIRPEALYIRGVDDMSTRDIFDYFKDYDPSSIEWINDTSCNVVWLDSQSAARALVGMSHPKKGRKEKRSDSSDKDGDTEPMEEDPRDEDEDTQDLISDKETGETERVTRSSPTDSAEYSQDCPSLPLTESEDSVQAMECLDTTDSDSRPVDISSDEAIRVGKSNPKADKLLLRFATRGDVKEKGAYKHSQYYIKYGNPNFGGMKGLISKSRMRQIKEGKFDPSRRRKRQYEMEDDDEEDYSRSSYPNKRHNQGDRHREERRKNPKDLRERLDGTHRDSASPKPSGSSGSDELEGDEDDLDAQLKHALGERSPPKRSRQMYADIEEKIKQIRKQSTLSDQINKVRDAREHISGRSLKDRLGHIRGAPTPAPSLENLKVIVDNHDEESEKDSKKSVSDDEDEEDEDEEVDYHTIQRKDSDLRRYLRNRKTTKKLLDSYPSLQIEVQDDV